MEKQLWHSCKNPLSENLICALSGICANLWAGTHRQTLKLERLGFQMSRFNHIVYCCECKKLSTASTSLILFRARKKVLGFFPINWDLSIATWSISAVRNHESNSINAIIEIKVFSNQYEMKGKYINTAMNADAQFIPAHFLCSVGAERYSPEAAHRSTLFFLTTILGESRVHHSRFCPSWKRLAALTNSCRHLEQNAPENTEGKIEKCNQQGYVSSHTERARGGRK